MAFSPDQTQIASILRDHTIGLWDVSTGTTRHILRDHSDSIEAVAFSPDAKSIASVSCDKTAKIWDTATENCNVSKARKGWLRGTSSAKAVIFSAEGKEIVSVGDGPQVEIWDPVTGETVQKIESE